MKTRVTVKIASARGNLETSDIREARVQMRIHEEVAEE